MPCHMGRRTRYSVAISEISTPNGKDAYLRPAGDFAKD
tara:strand:- start:71 stop:184 length:114 start_codon:yes stop_codon:yes gene_type:complete